MTSTTESISSTSGTTGIREFGHELRSYLTGKGAVVEYAFDQLAVEVPPDHRPGPTARHLEAARHGAHPHWRPGQPQLGLVAQRRAVTDHWLHAAAAAGGASVVTLAARRQHRGDHAGRRWRRG